MLKFLRTCLFFAAFVCGSFLSASEDAKCSIAKIPAWVKETPFNRSSSQSADEGESLQYLLLDYQMDIDHGEKFTRVIKILPTVEAVQQNSILKFEFDPSYQSLTLHHITIYRNQEIIDKIPSSKKEIIQQENGLDDYLYNGRKMWVVMLDDIQKGDIIDYSFSKCGENPAFNGIHSEQFYLNSSYHIKHANFRIIGSQNRKLHFKWHGKSWQPAHRLISDGMQEWSWEIFDLEPFQEESSCPNWHFGYPAIQSSEFANWSEVAQWGAELFKLQGNYSPEIQALVNQWLNQSKTDEEQILQALRFVQNDVRYLGLEMGTNTQKPTDPNIVFQRRYGDCKDKTLLLRALLNLMGIESQPVLVSTQLKEHISNWHPANIFDHVILQISYQDRIHWVDSTLSNQECTSLGKNHIHPYGKGLLLDPKSIDLSDMPQGDLISNIVAITWIELHSSESDSNSLFKTKIFYHGSEADRIRGIHRQIGFKELEKYFHRYFAERYGILEKSEPLKISDDIDNHAFILEMSYILLDPWKKSQDSQRSSFSIFPKHLYESIDFNVNPLRESPLALNHPAHVVEVISIEDMDGTWSESEEKNDFESDEIAFNFSKNSDSKNLYLRYELRTKKDHVPAHKINEHRKLLQAIEDLLFLEVSVPIHEEEEDLETEPLENDNLPLLGIMTILFAWVVYLLARKRKTTGGET